MEHFQLEENSLFASSSSSSSPLSQILPDDHRPIGSQTVNSLRLPMALTTLEYWTSENSPLASFANDSDESDSEDEGKKDGNSSSLFFSTQTPTRRT
mmetsp:Transcript_16775/g.42125  ORF Transcript_16775/g.42125 Transcript_16775/m.42125 type:complete len:97 (+) Transcript_16775:112-402(+)|eukprot:CAMPEP_0113897622 /NCGR_PEP_ID=MMETSP0780_2-20120614/18815_1 /TAXON_ID=652834 /ORGANISM="Palpitomonas bilix" /LENGTH=96 /DNA_ID=CAMNT_0000889173 /DNA_START=103 /DNA_END=393 /DNA_ORIENTATION=+ /assembly_acc=CAM_ASM_000599